jgi:hypothetical protein
MTLERGSLKDVLVVDASAHSYNLAEDNYAAGRYSKAVVHAFHGAHHGLSPAGYRLPREKFSRDWTLEETANLLFVESHGANWQPDNMTTGAQRKLADRRKFVRSRSGA